MRIRWTPEATADLEQTSDYIAQDSSEAALETIQTIFSRVEELTTFPRRGRKGREEGTRELVMTPLPYIAVYRVVENVVQILHI